MDKRRRKSLLRKLSQQTDGILSNQQVNIETSEPARNTKREDSQLNQYNLSFDHPKDERSVPSRLESLSTRYVPGMPGVQAQKVPGTQNVYKDPNSKKVFDYNDGFELDGVIYNPQGVHFQSTHMYSYASEANKIADSFKKKGLLKEARLLRILFERR